MTTKVKKKGVLAYQEAPQRQSRADCSSRSRRDSLQFKSTNPLQEKWSWPKINLTVSPSRENPAACNNLDLGTQKKFTFIPCMDLDHWWSLLRGSLCSLQDCCTFLASGGMRGHREKADRGGSQQCFKVAGARTSPWQGRWLKLEWYLARNYLDLCGVKTSTCDWNDTRYHFIVSSDLWIHIIWWGI